MSIELRVDCRHHARTASIKLLCFDFVFVLVFFLNLGSHFGSGTQLFSMPYMENEKFLPYQGLTRDIVMSCCLVCKHAHYRRYLTFSLFRIWCDAQFDLLLDQNKLYGLTSGWTKWGKQTLLELAWLLRCQKSISNFWIWILTRTNKMISH